MSTSQNGPEKPDQTQTNQTVSQEALDTLVDLRQTLVDELLALFERNIFSRSNWLLAIAGGTFAALLSSGLIKPGSVKWQTKELLLALSVSSLFGIIVRFYNTGRLQLTTLSKSDIEKIKKTFAKEFGDDSEKSRIWRITLRRYLMAGFMDLFKSVFSARAYQKLQRKLAATNKQKLSSEESILKKQVRQMYFLQAQFWILLIGMLIHVLLVIFTY
jgi:hypothetical protein